jgi:glucose/arabinose dehydrogenase
MPAIFVHGKPASLTSVLDGDPVKQKDALWGYFALGKAAPNPKPPPALPIPAPAAGEEALIAQVPLHFPDGRAVESIGVLTADHDLVVYDVAAGGLDSAYTGAQLLRGVQGRSRTYTVAGTPVAAGPGATPAVQLLGPDKAEAPTSLALYGYDRLADGVRIRRRADFPTAAVEIVERLRVIGNGDGRRLLHELRVEGVPTGRTVEWRTRAPDPAAVEVQAIAGTTNGTASGGAFRAVLTPDDQRVAAAVLRHTLPAPRSPPAFERVPVPDPGPVEGSLERPGYRAIAYPRPRTVSGEDLIMPGAVAADPKDGRVFIASLKTGGLYVLRDPTDDGKAARFEDYARGLFQDAYSMLAEPDGLYVLHRRNLTRVTDTDGDGKADRFDRVAALPHGTTETYDYPYGLARDRTGAFVISYAPYANRHLAGSGGAVRLVPGREPREVAYGFRNPVGWCAGPDGEVFFTDNQGEWVASNKLCHLAEGRFYGFPNPGQRQHTTRPRGKTAVWVPYGWAKSINGVTYDATGGRFGPFAGQLFLAELMYGGGIIRADVEKVNGEYQGACFPFWGRGLLGPVTLAFDPRGRLFVGGITEPGWMAQPDRGALFRIDFTGNVPFEMKTIRALPNGFRVVFTRPADAATARDPAAYRIESYRYEYTSAYGSPELDRTRLAVERVELSADGLSADLITPPLVKDRVYMVEAGGVRSAAGEALVHPAGAYTLNEVPALRR